MRKNARILLAAVIVAAVPCVMAAGEARVALVVGNAGYEHAPLLNNPLNDAADVTAAFQRLGFAVTVLENADQSELRRGLQQFARAAAVAQFAVVYYAGHGIEVDRRNFLVPVDARLASDADVEFETVPLDLVMRSVSRAAFRLVILDACRENPFARTMQSAAGTTRSIGRGLALIEPPGGMLVAYSAKEGTLAEDGDGRNSPYAQALLRVLREEPDLEVGIMFRHVRDEVVVATGGRQEPFTYGSLPKEGIYFQPPSQDPSPQPESGPDAGSTPSAVAVVIQPSPAALVVDEIDEIRWALSAAQVYGDPDAGSAVVSDLQPGVEVEVTGTVRDSGWLRIVLDGGGVGFVAGSALIDRYPIDEVEGVYRVERPANVRSGPGVSYQKVGRLERGDEVTATGKFHESDWLRIVLDGGGVGFVTAPMLSDRFPVDEIKGVYRAVQAVEVRSGFGIGWQTVETLQPGTEVEATGRTRVAGIDWLRISRVGAEGYVSAGGMRDTEGDEAAFVAARNRGTIGAYQTYLRHHPHGRHAVEAQGQIAQAKTRDDEAFARAREAGTEEAYTAYLKAYPGGSHVAEVRRLLDELVPAVGSTFTDCAECSEMVVVPNGSFMMGSRSSEERRDDDEGPRHRVTIAKPFAVGVYEVTFDEWDACVRGGGCGGYRPDDEGWGRGTRPVINVSWEDAQGYVRWLSQRTGEKYRLLSEAEWEYVARAGRVRRSTLELRSRRVRRTTMASTRTDRDGKGRIGDGRCRWDRSRRTRSGCTTCTATCGSGRRIAGTTVTAARRRMEVRGREENAVVVWCAGAPGTAYRGACAPPIATGTAPVSAGSTSVFELPGRSPRESLNPYFGGPGGGAPWPTC